jgi:hypothetical protein
MKQHKWHKEIKAWADGAEIECRRLESWGWGEWETFKEFYWFEGDVYEYRIKPQPKESQYLYVYLDDDYEFSPIPLTNEWEYIGKIKLEDSE